MRIHYKIRTPTPLAKWHVLLPYNQTNDTFLTMPRRKFVSDFWYSSLSCDHFNQILFIEIRS